MSIFLISGKKRSVVQNIVSSSHAFGHAVRILARAANSASKQERHISDIPVFIRNFPGFAVTIDETRENF